jgi:maltose alpha-D-glucosyltransferase/alpha-amylase
MKMFRRVEEGPNPDVEIGEFLARRGFTRVPQLVGSISYVPGAKGPDLPPRHEVTSIAMLQKYVWNQGNGWQVTIDELERFFERSTGMPLPADAEAKAAHEWAFGRTNDAPPSVAEAIRAYLALADILGRRTGELHMTLADSTDAAFAPEPMTKDNLDETIAVMRRRAQSHLALLETELPRLDDRIQPQAREVLERRHVLLQQFDELRGLTGSSARIRCHGDYHLGQILVTEGDVVILDFEGEPARPLHERRAKSSPLRDIAGMMRSFSYAALTAVGAVTQTRPDDARRLSPWADFWETWISASFLRSYLIATRHAPFLPPPADLDVMLRAYILDKALYELAYELNNRPSWVYIPLTGVLQLRPRLHA